LSAQVFHGRNKARGAERVRPIIRLLPAQLINAAAARQVIEGRSRFRDQNNAQALRGELRQLDWLKFRARCSERVERFFIL
jgi:hypothetical protein